MKQYRVISADSHAIEPPDLWQQYLPQAYKDRGPRVVSEADRDIWVCEGLASRLAKSPLGAVARNRDKAYATAAKGATRYDSDPDAWDPHKRVEFMQTDGVDAEVLYPNYAMRIFAIPDPELLMETCRAYNTWVADFCGTYPQELLGIAVIPALDIDWAIQECRRAKDNGLVGVLLPQDTPDGSRYSASQWDPLWATLAELQMPLSLHIIASGHANANWAKDETGEESATIGYAVLPVRMARAFGTFIVEGVFDRHPGLKLISAENELSWAANFVQRLDWGYHRQKMNHDPLALCERLPSEYWRQNCYLTFIDNLPGVMLREFIGVDRMMWSSDFPHLDSSWPESQQFLNKHLAGVPAEESRLILAANCARLYNLQ